MDSDAHAGPKIAFIGVGAMGLPMVRNILKNGYPVTVHDRVDARAEAAVALGASWSRSCREAAEKADVIITILPTAADVRTAVLGPCGIIEGIRAGATLIEMSTIEAEAVQAIGAALLVKGVNVLGAPVVRGVKGAETGTLAIYAGGDPNVLDVCRPILTCLGNEIIFCGELGTGNTVKLINNMVVGVTVCLLSEAMVLGVKAGVDPDALFNGLSAGSANSFVLQNHIKNHSLTGNFPEGMFSIDYEMKDLSLALATAEKCRLPQHFAALAYQIFQQARASGLGQKFYPAVIQISERLANVAVRTARADFK